MNKKDQQILDSQIEAQAFLNRFDFASSSNYAEALQDIREQLEQEIAKTTDKTRQKRFKALKKQANEELKNIYDDYKGDLEEDNLTAGEVGYKKNVEGFGKAGFNVSKATPFARLPKSVIKSFSALQSINMINQQTGGVDRFNTQKEIDKLLKDHQKLYRSVLNRALGTGMSIEQAVDLFIAEAGKIDGVKVNNIRAITRTSVNQAMATARKYSEEKNFSDIITGYQILVTLDSRTTFICASLAGNVYKKRSDCPYGEPPYHFNCRTVMMAITGTMNVNEYTARSRIQDQVIGTSKGEIKSRWEVVSDKDVTVKNPIKSDKYSSFDNWFKTLPKERQIQWLGSQRYKIYETGKLGTGDLIRADGKIRTVNELSQRLNLTKDEKLNVKARNLRNYKPRITRTAQKIYDERKVR